MRNVSKVAKYAKWKVQKAVNLDSFVFIASKRLRKEAKIIKTLLLLQEKRKFKKKKEGNTTSPKEPTDGGQIDDKIMRIKVKNKINVSFICYIDECITVRRLI